MNQRVQARRQIVLPMDGRSDLICPTIRGGKGTSLAVMHGLGLRVPRAFTVSTTAMRGYLANGVLAKRFASQLKREMEALEKATGKKFGDQDQPLLVSVRSGAATSMSGMMDTILNLGMSQSVRDGFTNRDDATFGGVLYERFTKGWHEIAGSGVIPNDPWEQLERAVLMVIGSWNNERARIYREHYGISHDLGTAVNVQAMVYGNRDKDSGTGVVFSHDVNTGVRGLYGEFLPCAQGEELMSGKSTPHPIELLKDCNQAVYEELSRGVILLAQHEQAMVEVEFTVESGVLYFLQHRKAKASLEARVTSLVHDVWGKRITHDVALASVDGEELKQIAEGKQFDQEVIAEKLEKGVIVRGIAASPGVASGEVAYTSHEAVEMARLGKQVILVRPDTDPDDLPGMLASSGIITLHGGATCHAAVVARALGKPAIVGASLPDGFVGTQVSLDGSRGFAVPGLVPTRETTLKKEVSLFMKWYLPAFPQPTFDYSWAARRTSVLQHMFHVYILELMAHEAKGSQIGHKVEALKREWYLKTAELFGCYVIHAVASELRHVDCVLNESHPPEVDQYRNFSLGWATHASKEQICEYLRDASIAFRQSHVEGSSIAGNKWAVIAETVLDFFEGKLGHILFVDRVFDLEHNTGHVFDKHVMVSYHHITRKHFKMLLDQKKKATGSKGLMALWRNEAMGRFTFDPRLLEFVKKGESLNIWR